MRGNGQIELSALLPTIHDRLLAEYGPQSWWPTTSGSPWEIMLGAVLTQRTSWSNVVLSLGNLEAAFGPRGLTDPSLIAEAPLDMLAAVLRPTGFHTSKPRRVQELARYVLAKGGAEAFARSSDSTEALRSELLALHGIGPETADAILLYVAGRAQFVADAYALRLAARWGLARPTATYAEVQRLFAENLPPSAELFNEYHALIIAHAKGICRPRARCEVCPLGVEVAVEAAKGGPAGWRCPRLYAGRRRAPHA